MQKIAFVRDALFAELSASDGHKWHALGPVRTNTLSHILTVASINPSITDDVSIMHGSIPVVKHC